MEGLFQEIEGPELGRFDGRLDGALARDHDDLGDEGPLPDLRQDLEAAAARHPDVEQDEVDADRVPEHLEAVLAGRGLEVLVALVLEDHLQGFPDPLLVVDDEDPGLSLGFHRASDLSRR